MLFASCEIECPIDLKPPYIVLSTSDRDILFLLQKNYLEVIVSLKTISVVCVLIVSLTMVSCKKKEEQPIPTAPAHTQQIIPAVPMGIPTMPSGNPHGDMKPKTEKKIIVPDSVKNKWSKVKIAFEDKKAKKVNEHIIGIGADFAVPNTKFKIVVGEFLPDFRMDGSVITSASAELNNPAVRVEVFEDGKSIFKGWLYSKFPDVHPFEHEQYGILFKEVLK